MRGRLSLACPRSQCGWWKKRTWTGCPARRGTRTTMSTPRLHSYARSFMLASWTYLCPTTLWRHTPRHWRSQSQRNTKTRPWSRTRRRAGATANDLTRTQGTRRGKQLRMIRSPSRHQFEGITADVLRTMAKRMNFKPLSVPIWAKLVLHLTTLGMRRRARNTDNTADNDY